MKWGNCYTFALGVGDRLVSASLSRENLRIIEK